ncbi:ATPase activity protein [Halocaridina rubra]|uniref:ATPase activity protein n=1 Tax=Halocaridina rubra TaxID=373956 RepID=A0AAN8ZWL0_HALRR
MSKTSYDNPAFQKGDETIIPIEKEATAWARGERITYSWHNLNVYADIPQGCWKRKKEKLPGKKHILKNVNGIVRPGELLAIMGASGAGKTTLLNVLTFMSDPAISVEGDLHINGQKVTPGLLTSRSAYVQQDDLFIGTFTVKEQLLFQVRMFSG